MTDIIADDGFDEDEAPQPSELDMMLSQPELLAASGLDLAFRLDSDELAKITVDCLEAYRRDVAERAEWTESFDKIMDLVRSKRTMKTFPWPGAANVKYPLIMKAALKFGSRAYPAIVNGSDVVKSAAVGDDENGKKRARGDRVSMHMNYQLLHDMPEWDVETDRLCHSLPLQGTMFRQVVWDKEYTRPLTTLISGKDLVVTQCAKDLETVPHFAKEFPLFIHQIKERQRKGVYREVDLGIDDYIDKEDAGKQDMLECHCRYDLDGDGYEEPLIAVIHKESEELLSLKPGYWPNGVMRGQQGEILCIRRHVEFIKYEFLPDPEGQFYGIGFGQLLLENAELINSIFNQLLDAATDQNTGGGFIARGGKLKAGNMEYRRGEWKFVNMDGDDLRKAIVPRPTSQPSPVLFNLVSMLIEASRELASDNDVTSGSAPANQPATTTLAIIEQGMQVFSSIYKRIYRALTKELRLIAKLNAAYLPPEAYLNVIDWRPEQPEQPPQPGPMGPMPMQMPAQEPPTPQTDYAAHDRDIIPVADPSMTTSAQRLQRAQFLQQLGAESPIAAQMLDQREIMRRVLEAASIDDIESLMPKPTPEQQQQAAEAQQLQKRAAMAEIALKESQSIKNQADAQRSQIEGQKAAQPEPVETGTQMDLFDLEKLKLESRKLANDERKTANDEKRIVLDAEFKAQQLQAQQADKQRQADREVQTRLVDKGLPPDFSYETDRDIERQGQEALIKQLAETSENMSAANENLSAAIAQAQQGQMQTQQMISEIAQALTAPKRIIRDSDGNVIGAETQI